MQRRTRQRAAIREAIEGAGRPLSPQEILDAAQGDIPGLGVATVYRTIRALVDEEWLREVELPGEASRYEVAHLDHHHHFHCNQCDRVFDMDRCPGSLRELAPRGFRVESHEIILYGCCPECR